MNDDYKRGLVTGLAMQPLYVVKKPGGAAGAENFCGCTVIIGIASDDGYCRQIVFEEG